MGVEQKYIIEMLINSWHFFKLLTMEYPLIFSAAMQLYWSTEWRSGSEKGAAGYRAYPVIFQCNTLYYYKYLSMNGFGR